MDVSQLPQCSTQITLEPPVGRHRPESSETDTLADSVQVRCYLVAASPASTDSFPQSMIEYLLWLSEALDFLRPDRKPQALVVESSSEGSSQGVSVRERPGLSLSDRYDGNAARVAQLLLLPDQLGCRLYALLKCSVGVSVRVSMDEKDMEGANVLTCSFENPGCPATIFKRFGSVEFSNIPDLYYIIGVKYTKVLHCAMQNASK